MSKLTYLAKKLDMLCTKIYNQISLKNHEEPNNSMTKLGSTYFYIHVSKYFLIRKVILKLEYLKRDFVKFN